MNREIYVAAKNLVGQNVLVCVSTLVYDLTMGENPTGEQCDFWLGPTTEDDWLDAATDNGAPFTSETDPEEVEDYCHDHGLSISSGEIYEHWVVSDWLADKLETHGELIVRDFHGLTIWGRPTTGQMIAMDGVIQDIAKSVGG